MIHPRMWMLRADHNLTLLEMKATRAVIKDAALNGFFFGATDNEFQMARAPKR